MSTLFPDPPPKPRRRTKPGKRAARQIDKAVAAMLKSQPSTEDIGELLDCIEDVCRRIEPLMNDNGTLP